MAIGICHWFEASDDIMVWNRSSESGHISSKSSSADGVTSCEPVASTDGGSDTAWSCKGALAIAAPLWLTSEFWRLSGVMGPATELDREEVVLLFS